MFGTNAPEPPRLIREFCMRKELSVARVEPLLILAGPRTSPPELRQGKNHSLNRFKFRTRYSPCRSRRRYTARYSLL